MDNPWQVFVSDGTDSLLLKEFDEEKEWLAEVAAERDAARAEVENLKALLQADQALFLACWRAIASACYNEDGLDCSDGIPVLERIEAVCPEARALEEERQRQPVT